MKADKQAGAMVKVRGDKDMNDFLNNERQYCFECEKHDSNAF